jgi:hypothetical protein
VPGLDHQLGAQERVLGAFKRHRQEAGRSQDDKLRQLDGASLVELDSAGTRLMLALTSAQQSIGAAQRLLAK